jgi:enoyl-CoA hydratase/carnithine racemase
MAVFEQIATDLSDRILTVTLNRPERLNAWTPTMARELIEAFDRADDDDEVRAVIVTGAGRAFCAGADLADGGETFARRGGALVETEPGADAAEGASDSEGAPAGAPNGEGANGEEEEIPRDNGGQVVLRMWESTKPIIAAINGPAVGVGATMTLPMDVRLASENARIGFVFVRRGIVPEACSSWFLPRIVGIGQALEWAMTGRVFSAEEGLEGGLLRSVHPAGELLEAARGLALEIAENTAPVSVALARRMLWRTLGAPHPMFAHRADSRGMLYRGRSADAAEGITAFLEKRPAQFQDRVSEGLPDVFPGWSAPAFE